MLWYNVLIIWSGNKFLSFESTPQYFASLQATFSIWGFQCIFSTRIIPRKLKVLTFSISPCFKIRLREKLLKSLCELWNIMFFVLLTFKDKRFATSQSLTLKNSPLIKILCSFGNAGREYVIVLNNVVSSAYRMKVEYSVAERMSCWPHEPYYLRIYWLYIKWQAWHSKQWDIVYNAPAMLDG